MGAEVLVEGGTGGVGGGQPRGLGVGVSREEGYEARPLDAGGEQYLTAEAGPELGVLRLRGMDDHDGDPQPGRVEAGVNGAHAA